MNRPNLLIIGNRRENQQDLRNLLRPEQFGLAEAQENANLELFFQRETPDLVLICCHGKSASDGLKAVDNIRRQNRQIPIILLTKHSSERRAIA